MLFTQHTGWHLLRCQSGSEHTTFTELVGSTTNVPVAQLRLIAGRKIQYVLYLSAGTYSLQPASNKNINAELEPISTADALHRLWRRVRNLLPGWRQISLPRFLFRVSAYCFHNKTSFTNSLLHLYNTTWEYLPLCGNSYHYWINKAEDKIYNRATEQNGSINFLISITGNSELEKLKKTLKSITQLKCRSWHCYIACHSSTYHELTKITSSFSASTTLLPSEFKTTSQLLNSALSFIPKESWLLPLLPGCQLNPAAINCLLAATDNNPELMGLLLDEDELSDEGTRANPTFKCKPDIYSLLSGVKPGYAVLFKTKWLLNQPSDDNNASLQDWIYKKFLQLVQQHSPEAIKHLPVVALHTVPELCAHKPVRHTAEQCLAAEQQKPEVMEQASGLLRLQWPLPEPAPLVSVLIPTKDRLDILKPCLDTLLSVTEYPDFEVLILDNQTTCPEALAFMKVLSEQDARVHVLPWNYPFNFAAINNFGAKHAKGSVLALVNNDIEPISPHWLQEMVSLACLPDTGCVGAKLYYPNGAIQHAGVVLGLGGVAGHSDRFSPGNAAGYLQRLQHVREVSAVTAACLVVKKELFERVGGMNEEHLAVNYNDIDFCLKVNALGYKNLWTPHAELVHHESVSRGPATSKAHIKRARQEADYMYKTWGNRLCADPFYSPNFSLIHEEVSLRAVE